YQRRVFGVEYSMTPKLLILGLASLAAVGAGIKAEDLVGTWKGKSLCVDKKNFPNCHDETAVYHVTKTKDGKLSVRGCRVVNGHEVEMGTLVFNLDSKRSELGTSFDAHGSKHTILFTVSRTKWIGLMKSPEGKI